MNPEQRAQPQLHDALTEMEQRVSFINYAVGVMQHQSVMNPMPQEAWGGLFYLTLDILDALKEAKSRTNTV